jgi:cupin fold WbuC family metalloprotein
MQNIFHSEREYVSVGPEWIDRLKGVALASSLRRSRLCLHRGDGDLVHEMIIALAGDCLFKPHRHFAKSESYHMIDGRMVFIMFDNNGTSSQAALLTPPGQGGTFCFRISEPIYHAVLPLDNVVVYQETTNGPFKPGEATIAPWAPEGTEELRVFLEKAATACGVILDSEAKGT